MVISFLPKALRLKLIALPLVAMGSWPSLAQEDGRQRELSTPTVVSSAKPALRVSLYGEPQLRTIKKSPAFMQVINASSFIVFDPAARSYYLDGGDFWFKTDDLKGAWQVMPQPPPAVAALAPEKTKQGAATKAKRASAHKPPRIIVSTVPVRLIVTHRAPADTPVTQTSAINRKSGELEVSYDGQPKFEPIADTAMTCAVNASVAVILVGGRYYAFDKGVWYEAAGPSGPWLVCASVPQVIDTIPPGYTVGDVPEYGSTPDTGYVGYTAYTAGCRDAYPCNGIISYGTGCAYRPWCGSACYPGPFTCGLRSANAYNTFYALDCRVGHTNPGFERYLLRVSHANFERYLLRVSHANCFNLGLANWVLVGEHFNQKNIAQGRQNKLGVRSGHQSDALQPSAQLAARLQYPASGRPSGSSNRPATLGQAHQARQHGTQQPISSQQRQGLSQSSPPGIGSPSSAGSRFSGGFRGGGRR